MMHQSSKDMIAFVDQVGSRLRSVVPKYQRQVTANLPQPDQAREWIKTFLEVHQRFCKGDYRHTSLEFGAVAELAQWLANLHAATIGGYPKQLTIVEENMIVRERIVG